jgi:heat shock protein HslJ
MSKLNAACVASLAVAILLSTACTTTKPPAVALRVLPKAKKAIPEPESFEEYELDEEIPHGSPSALHKNLPLAGTSWEWEGSFNQEQFDRPEQPSAYRLEFKSNGWFDFQADCRHGAGIYEINGQRIVLAVIKATHSACQKGSKAEDFQSALEGAKSFSKSDGKLYFELKHDTKTIVFTQKL